MPLPVCPRSPIFNLDIVTDLPFSRITSAEDGKQPGGGGGGAGVGGNGVAPSSHLQQCFAY